MNIFIYSNGCIPNNLQGSYLKEIAIKNKHELVENQENADCIVFISCGFSSCKVDESIKILDRYRNEYKKNQKILITGCLHNIIELEKYLTNEILIIEYSKLNEYFKFNEIFDEIKVSGYINDSKTLTGRSDIYHIVTSIGCLGSCTYCAIKKARGKIRSKPDNEVLNEIQAGINKKYKKFILWGDDLGAYGQDRSSNIVHLLNTIVDKYSNIDIKIYLHRINPQWIIKYEDDFKNIFISRLFKLVYIPIQSGSNMILNKMNRPYNREEIVKAIKELKTVNPNIIFKTDIMIGFPSETDEDFKLTLEMLGEDIFDDIETFKYGKIINTPAYYYSNQISDEIMQKRMNLIWKCFSLYRFYIRRENKRYNLIDKGNVNEEGLYWTLKNITPDFYE